jgi:glucose/arabinose dehydrogenase
VPALRLERVLGDFDLPLQVTAATHRRQLYVVEQSRRIRVARRASVTAPWERAGEFLDLRSKVAGPFVGRGLLGLAFHPAFAENDLFYVFYTRKHPQTRENGDILIAEYRADTPLRADPSSARTVMVIAHPSSFHFGGWMGFGPDGYLYISTGDAANLAFGFPQDLECRLGKILRIDPTDPEGDADFSVPTDNPFVGEPGDDAIWAYGFRNPWRASFDRETGALWVADVGQGRFEEVNRASPSTESRGANYGWSHCEGRHQYGSERDPPPCADPALTLPIIEYAHDVPEGDDRCSVIGGHVYRALPFRRSTDASSSVTTAPARSGASPPTTRMARRSILRWTRASSSRHSGRTRGARSTSPDSAGRCSGSSSASAARAWIAARQIATARGHHRSTTASSAYQGPPM